MKIKALYIPLLACLLLSYTDFTLADRYSDAVCDGDCGNRNGLMNNIVECILVICIIAMWWGKARTSKEARLWFTAIFGGGGVLVVTNSENDLLLFFGWVFIVATWFIWVGGESEVERSYPNTEKEVNQQKLHEDKETHTDNDVILTPSIKNASEKKEFKPPIKSIVEIDRRDSQDNTHNENKPTSSAKMDEIVSSIYQSSEPNNNKIFPPPQEGSTTPTIKCPFCRTILNAEARVCYKCRTGFSTE